MNAPTPVSHLAFLPETAPFSTEQRAWLNGFFAGILAPQGAPVAAPADAAALAAPQDDGAPWHDPAMALDERMKLAEGKALPRRLMAAMAQQDCGQCGYNCEDYSAAIAGGKEARLNLCVPGGKDTARMVKALAAELDGAVPAAAPAPAAPAALGPPGTSRDNPAPVTLVARHRLNKGASEKETWHVEFDLSAAGLDYTVGDSFGIYPENDPGLVEAVMAAISAPSDCLIDERPLADLLACDVALGAAPDGLFQLLTFLTGGERRRKARALAA
ncbi:MAG: (Fe-S)-binding protein, partial [Xanthobacteraceae bacterium]